MGEASPSSCRIQVSGVSPDVICSRLSRDVFSQCGGLTCKHDKPLTRGTANAMYSRFRIRTKSSTRSYAGLISSTDSDSQEPVCYMLLNGTATMLTWRLPILGYEYKPSRGGNEEGRTLYEGWGLVELGMYSNQPRHHDSHRHNY